LFEIKLIFYGLSRMLQFSQRNWVFATKSDFMITISLETNFIDLRYFKLWILLNQIIRVWNIKGLQLRVLKILMFKYLILFQRLNSFVCIWALSYSVWDVFNKFLLIDTTDKSKISSDQKRFFIALSLYPLSFFANTLFKIFFF